MIAIELHSELYPGRVALVDDDDLSLVADYAWCPSANGYAVARIGGRVEYMHRLIMPGAKMIDHANGDKLDNRRANLREATPAQNNANRVKKAGTSSVYKGVTWSRSSGKWAASVQSDGRKRHLGYFSDESDAARAYDQAALERWGEYARPNFPDRALEHAI